MVPLETDGESDSVGGLHDPRTPESEAASAQFRERLDGLVGELSPRSRAVFVLRDIEGLPYEEIAQVLRVPGGTVRSRINRARSMLKRKLQPLLRRTVLP